MSNHLKPYVEAVIAGSPVNVEAKKAGVHFEKLRRLVLKHPGYEMAKAQGYLHKPGLPGIAKAERDPAEVSAAIAEVFSGTSVTKVGTKYGIPVSSLCRIFKQAHPNIVLKGGELAARRKAEVGVTKAQENLAEARRNLSRFTQPTQGPA